jgi:hypothetical protein
MTKRKETQKKSLTKKPAQPSSPPTLKKQTVSQKTTASPLISSNEDFEDDDDWITEVPDGSSISENLTPMEAYSFVVRKQINEIWAQLGTIDASENSSCRVRFQVDILGNIVSQTFQVIENQGSKSFTSLVFDLVHSAAPFEAPPNNEAIFFELTFSAQHHSIDEVLHE